MRKYGTGKIIDPDQDVSQQDPQGISVEAGKGEPAPEWTPEAAQEVVAEEPE